MNAWHRTFWRIDAYLTGAPFSAGAEARLRAHLQTCASCRAHYDQGVALLRAARAATGEPGAGELERLVRRAANVSRGPSRSARWRPAIGLAAAAAVAVLLVVFSGPRMAGKVALAGQRTLVAGVPCATSCMLREGELVAAIEGPVLLALEGGRKVALAEGSVVAVTKAGALVRLEAGRARFDVDPGHGQFGVQAGTTRVEVKGTSFGVARWGESEVVVAVESGRVEVEGTNDSVLVEGGQRTRVGADGTPDAPSAIRPADVDLLRELGRLGEEIERAVKRLWRR